MYCKCLNHASSSLFCVIIQNSQDIIFNYASKVSGKPTASSYCCVTLSSRVKQWRQLIYCLVCCRYKPQGLDHSMQYTLTYPRQRPGSSENGFSRRKPLLLEHQVLCLWIPRLFEDLEPYAWRSSHSSTRERQ